MAKKDEVVEEDGVVKAPVVEVLKEPTKMNVNMLMGALKDKEARDRMLRDETLEPHIHLGALLVLVFALSVIIMVIY